MAVDVTAEDAADHLVEITRVLGRSLRIGDAGLQSTLDSIVALAAHLTGFETGLALVKAKQLEPQAATGSAPHALDVWQRRHGAGPCVDAALSQERIDVVDTRTETRWTGFGDYAAQHGVVSMLCFPLWVDDRQLGTLSLYAGRPAAFDVQDERVAMVCATLAAVALADAIRTENLHAALANRDLIGQAKGILVERHKLTPDAAFGRLADVSQRRNVKLTVVAGHLVETGQLLGDD